MILPAVYLRTAHQLEREVACLVAATDGSTCFLLMPKPFWKLPDVAPLVRAAAPCRLLPVMCWLLAVKAPAAG